jgi:hypothetical protein
MKLHSRDSFLKWSSKHNIVLDPRYPESESLAFVDDGLHDRFWEIPSEPERRPYFFRCMLKALGDWKSTYCWRHLGTWSSPGDEMDRISDQVERIILTGLGLPIGTEKICEFNREEEANVVTLLLSTSIFGFTQGDDLFLVSDTAESILQTDHHGVMHASFRSEDLLMKFIQLMEEEEYSLPRELPDWTFKRPDWMKGK